MANPSPSRRAASASTPSLIHREHAHFPGSSLNDPPAYSFSASHVSLDMGPERPSVDRRFVHGTSTAIELNNVTDHGQEESQHPPRYTEENDPLGLARRLKSNAEIRSIVNANESRKRDQAPAPARAAAALLGRPPLASRTASSAQLSSFYQAQNANIEQLLKPVDEHVRLAREAGESNHLRFRIATYGSFGAALMLAGVQLYGAISSGSLSLFTTMADAMFDPLSNLSVLVCDKAVKRVDGRKFPAGKARIETAGNIFFCFLMTCVSWILIAFSARELMEGSKTPTSTFHLPSIIAVGIAWVTKFGLFCYCWALRNQYSQVRMLWEDHRNDLMVNGVGIITSVLGSKVRWWIDPMGAILISILISALWLKSAYDEFQLLIGVTADTHTQQLITYICMPCPFLSLFALFPLFGILTIARCCSHDAFPHDPGHRHRPRLYFGPTLCRGG